jgi:hypothetical protein
MNFAGRRAYKRSEIFLTQGGVMRISRLLSAGFAVLLLAACSEPLDTGIIGVWHGTTPPQSLEFRSSGTVMLEDRKLNRRYQGRYKLNGRRLEMQFDSFGRPVVREAKISGDTLTLYRDKGPPEILHR